MTIQVNSPDVYTAEGVALKVTGVAQVIAWIFFLVCITFHILF